MNRKISLSEDERDVIITWLRQLASPSLCARKNAIIDKLLNPEDTAADGPEVEILRAVRV